MSSRAERRRETVRVMAERDITTVIDHVLAVVPAHEEGLRGDLARCRQSAIFAAPEAMHVHWSRAQAALFEAVGLKLPKTGWKRRALEIWRGNR